MMNPKKRCAARRVGFVEMATLVVAIPLATLGPAMAQPGHPCSRLIEPVQRLACYDEAFPPPVATEDAVRQQAERDFGRRTDEASASHESVTHAADPERIQGAVAKLEYANGNRVISLTQGQVWTTVDRGTMGHLSQGDEVTVRKGVLGGYVLETPAGVGLRVRRTR